MTNLPATLLIVDDDRELVSLLAATAESLGYQTTTATTLGEAIGLIERWPPDVAIVDVVLGGESGLDLLPRMKELTPESEVVVISGTTLRSSAFTSYEMPAFAFVEKPFDR